MMQLLQFPVQDTQEGQAEFETYALNALKLEQAAESSREEAAALRDELEALIAQMEKLRTQTLETEKENHLTRHALLNAQRQCNEHQQEIVHLTAQSSSRERDYVQLKAEMAILQEENVQLQDQQTQLRHSLTESHALCQSNQNTYSALKESYRVLQDDLQHTHNALKLSYVEQESLQSKLATLAQDHQNLVVSLASLTEGFFETQAELLFAKQLLVEKTKFSADFFLLQEESKARIEQLEEVCKTHQQAVDLHVSTIEKLQQSENELLKRIDRDSACANEHIAALKRDYNKMMHQAQAAQEELTRYRELQGRLLPVQRFFQNLSPLLQRGENNAALAQAALSLSSLTTTSSPPSQTAGGPSAKSPMDFHEESWSETHLAHSYRPIKNNFFEP